MGKLYDDDHVPTILTTARVLLLRLNATPRTRVLAPRLEAALVALVTADAVWAEAHIARLAAYLDLEFQDGEEDLAWMNLSRSLHARVGGNREHTLWRGLYSEAPSDTVAGVATDHQVRHVERVIQTIRDQAAYEDFRPQAEALAVQHADMLESQERYKAALARDEAASHQRSLAAVEARRAYNRVKPELELLFEDEPRLIKAFWGS